MLVSHDMAEVATLAEWLLVLHDGHLVMQGTPRSVHTKGDALRKWCLAAPPLSELPTLLRKSGLAIPEEVFTLDEAFALVRARFIAPHREGRGDNFEMRNNSSPANKQG